MKIASKAICILLLSCNSLYTSELLHSYKLLSKKLNVFLDNCNIELSQPKQDAILNISLFTALITYIATIQYSITTYGARQDMLVKADYPIAQAWYDAMAIKYPNAHLADKLFLQTIRNVNKKHISWCSTPNQIYFPQDALQEIETLYKKELDGAFLTDEEKITLGKQEFILLHEAGHIEHNDIIKRYLSLIGAYSITEIARAYIKESYPDYQFNFFDYYIQLILMVTLTHIPTRFQESAADAFAYSQADINALQGGISFFESEEVDPLWNIENKQLSPFVETNSLFGKIIQSYLNSIDKDELDQKKLMKSNSFFRWIYDYNISPTHPGASVRAQAIRNEIELRLQKESTQAA